jgi:hypothetical protein
VHGDAISLELRQLGVTAEPRLEELTHNRANRITDGIWKVRAGEFEAVLKVVTDRPGGDPHWQPSRDPLAWNYWRREPDVYRIAPSAPSLGQPPVPARLRRLEAARVGVARRR